MEITQLGFKPGAGAGSIMEQIFAEDSREISPHLKELGTYEPRSLKVPFSVYYDRDFAKLEEAQVWKKSWNFVCREEDLPEVGDKMPYQVHSISVFVVRSGADEFKAFYNSCLHRGTRLCNHPSSGESIRCPFHAWEWNNDGTLKHLPQAWDFPQCSKDKLDLPEVRVGRWGGFVFINVDPDAPSLEDSLGIIPRHFEPWDISTRYTAIHMRKKVRSNWKLLNEAFLEAYHTIETHSNVLAWIGDTQSSHDLFDDGVAHISKQHTPVATTSPNFEGDATADFIASDMYRYYSPSFGPDAGKPDVSGSGGNARAAIAAWLREVYKKNNRRDYVLSDAELIDSIQYFMFPNFYPWYGEGLPITYQFLPYGDNPEESLACIRLLLPRPEGENPPAAQVVDVDFDVSIQEAMPEWGSFALVLDQDFFNLPNIQAGLHGSHPDHNYLTLGKYQEKRIAYFYDVLDRLLGGCFEPLD